jgi:hypothetical protein
MVVVIIDGVLGYVLAESQILSSKDAPWKKLRESWRGSFAKLASDERTAPYP